MEAPSTLYIGKASYFLFVLAFSPHGCGRPIRSRFVIPRPSIFDLSINVFHFMITTILFVYVRSIDRLIDCIIVFGGEI